MPIMCEECKCSIYLEDRPDGTREYGGCDNGCECCNNPDYVSDSDKLVQIREYVNLHYISLNQDNDRIQDELDSIVDLDSDEYKFKEIEDISVSGQIIATSHILKYIDEVINV